ncbi:MAG: carboxypeptidase regulatory-like domain-containing protein, partial [Candidatus Cloacimonetes bacterium]|nr:carboxypeptidase regulatory-like domain-containing protein [Candidatus Cloacimonadota bacterium]
MKKVFLITMIVLIVAILTARPAINRTDFNGANNRDFEWDIQNSNFPISSTGVNYMWAVDENIVWAAGYDGSGGNAHYQIVTHTTDGGNSWTSTQINTAPSGGDTAMIFALDGNKAWAPIHTGNPQGIYYTDDGGQNWVRQESANYNLGGSFPNIAHFFNENDGFAQGDPVGGYYELYTTTDGGSTWIRVPEVDIPAPLTGEFGIVGYYDAVGDNVWWGTNKGRVFRSNDKGYTWEVSVTTLGGSTYTDVTFKDAMNGIAQDKNAATTGTICETSDGGVTWQAVTHTGNCYSNDMDYVPGTANTYVSTGAATGISGASYSHDGGHNWFNFDETEGIQFLATAWVNTTTGWSGCFNDQTNPALNGMYKYNGDLTPQPMGTVSGTVTDIEAVVPIEEAIITLGTHSTATNNLGEYEMLLNTGTYTLTCELEGYETYTQENVEIIENQTTVINIQLQHLYNPPQNLDYMMSGSNVTLTFQPPIGGFGLTNYYVYRNEAIYDTLDSSLTYYSDLGLPTGNYTYYLTALYFETYESVPSNEVTVEVVSADGSLLSVDMESIGNYPNPFNPSTTIYFTVNNAKDVKIVIYNVKGQRIK